MTDRQYFLTGLPLSDIIALQAKVPTNADPTKYTTLYDSAENGDVTLTL